MADATRPVAAPPLFRHALIVGTGLLGASLGLALRQSGAATVVSGWDRSRDHLDEALRRGALDQAAPALTAAGADLVVLATPVGAMPGLLRELAATAEAGTVVTDVGSVKSALAAAATCLPPEAVFVGGHPMAGKAEAGPAAASGDLFVGARWVLCPDPLSEASVEAARRLAALVRRLGAEPVLRTPASHDEQVAAISHLPQVASSALALAGIGLLPDVGEGLELAAGGWRDTTRLAASDPAVWRDICLANGPAVAAALHKYREQLDRFADAIAIGDGDTLAALFREAQTAKMQTALRTTEVASR